MKGVVACCLLACWVALPLHAQQSRLERQGTATRLVVEGKPYLVLGGEIGNSSASSEADIARIFPKLRRIGLNTVLVPAYWDLLEPVEGQFDFTLTDAVLEQARACGLKVIFLWFGAWKNSMSCYAPLWFKQDYKKYPRAYTQVGKPLEIASAFSEAVYQADGKAFSAWLEHIAEADREAHTVIMIQIENEIGMLEEARDHSAVADKAFQADVPAELTAYLKVHRKELHPALLAKWQAAGGKLQGNWQELFGSDLYTDELFMAWHYAKYVERMAQRARAIYDVPLYVNAAMDSRGRKPGEYPSAGPLAHLIDIWHCAAPSIDLLAPDLYDDGFTDWVARYRLPGNPLFIPEIRLADNDGVRAFYVFGEHDAMGFSPFSIEDASDDPDAPLVQAYGTLGMLMPLLLRYQGQGAMWGLLFDEGNRERVILDGDLAITCNHNFILPWDPRATDGSTWPEGGGILLRLAPDEYIVAGSGIVVAFAKQTEKLQTEAGKQLGEDGFAEAGSDAFLTTSAWKGMRCGIGSVDEVTVDEEGGLHYVRRLGGDQDHQGRHVRISVGEFSILHVKLYGYE